MPAKWDEVGHTVIDKADDEPIKANPTNIAKYGAPSVGIVTAVLVGLLGETWNLDAKMPAAVIAAAIIVAAVVLGIYLAFATDIRTRGAVTIARFEAIANLAATEATCATDAKRADAAVAAQKAAETELDSTKRELETTTVELDSTKDELRTAKRALGLLSTGDEISRVLVSVAKATNGE